MKFLSDILVKAGLTVENTFSANAASNTIYAGTGTRLRTEANNLVFERVSSSGTMKMVFAQGTLSPTAKSYIGYSNATLNLILANEYATAGLELRTSDVIRQQIFSNGNIVIGQASPVDAGYKMDVFGTVRASQLATGAHSFRNETYITPTTDGYTKQNSYNAASAYTMGFVGDLRFGAATAIKAVFSFNGAYSNNGTIYNGDVSLIKIFTSDAFGNPTPSANINGYGINLMPTLNYTQSTSNFTGIYYNPTLTATTGLTHYAMNLVSGLVRVGDLAGTGDRMVVANSSGVLSTQAIVNPSAILPVGGTTGQILAKIDNTNYNTEWIDNYTGTVKHTVKAGVALTKGQAVYVSSADGTNMIVSKASNATESTSSKTMGLIAQSLSVNGTGFVVTEGLLSGLDTSSAQAGDPVWLGTDGNLLFGLANKPYAPNHLVYIGVVTRAQQNNGEIFVNVQNGFELNEIHNVQITSTPSDNTVLAYEASTSLYKMKSIATLLGYTPYDSSNPAGYISGITSNMVTTALGFTPVTNARTITINGTTFDLTADRSFSVGTVTGSGSMGFVPKWSTSTALGNSLIYDAGTSVLIGTQTPGSAKFMVYSTTADNHYQAIGSAPSFRFADTITSPTYTGIIGMATASNHFIIGAAAGDMILSNNTNSAGNFLFGTGATERMRINATTGNISINNTNNTYRLDVTGTGRFTGILTLDSQLSFTTAGINYIQATNAAGNLTFGVAANNNAFVIRTTGQVQVPTFTSGVVVSDAFGILSISTAYATQSFVTSQGYITSAALAPYTLNSRTLTINGTTFDLSADRSWTVGNVSGTGTTNYLPKFTGTSTIGNSILQEGTNAIGLGVTPSAWSGTNVKAFQFGNSGALANSGTFGTIVFNNSYYDGGYKYITSNSASAYVQDGSTHLWYQASSGTAGNAISFTQAMTLNASGNLSIGNTNDTYKLDVSSNVNSENTIRSINLNSGAAATARIYVENNIGSLGQFTTYSSGFGFTVFGLFAGNYTALLSSGTSSAGLLIGSLTADPVIFGTDNTERMRITSAGMIGIGNAADGTGYGLELARTSSTPRIDLVDNAVYTGQLKSNGGLVTLQNSSNNALVFGTNNAERMRITSGGNVLIGSTDAAYGTFVAASSNSSGYTVASIRNMAGGAAFGVQGAQLNFYGDAGYTSGVPTGFIKVISNSGGNNGHGAMAFGTHNGSGSSLERMRITANGNVGINTSSPLYTLDVNGVASLTTVNYSTSAENSSIYFNNTYPSNYALAKIAYGTDGYFYAGYLSFSTTSQYQANSPVERMRITQLGNVGIGTTNPNTVLDVNTGINTSSATAIMISHNTNGAIKPGASFGLSIQNGGESTNAADLWFRTASGGSLSERMRITSGGNVGIGTTNPNGKLHIVSTVSTAGALLQGGHLEFYKDATPTYAASIGLSGPGSGSTNDLVFNTYSGSWAERMRITSAGQVLLSLSTGAGALGNGINIFTKTDTYTSGHGGLLQFQNEDVITAGIRGIRTTGWGSAMVFYVHNESAGNTFGTTFVERMRITEGGAICINATATTQGAVLYANGTAAFGQVYAGNLSTGALYSNAGFITNTNPSDFRLKNTIKPLTYGLNEVLQLNPKTFYYNDDLTKARLKYGFIAQEVKEVMPDMVRLLGSEDYLGLESEGIWVTLVNAIKEQQVQLNEQRTLINELKSQLNK